MGPNSIPQPSMIFAVISDIHLGPEKLTGRGDLRKLSNQSEELVNQFVAEMNQTVRPSFVVQLGDLIEDDTPETDRQNYRKGVTLLNRLQCPVFHVIGNHDVKKMTEQELRQLTSQPDLFYSFENGGYKFVTLFSQKNDTGNLVISTPQIEWLKKELTENAAKTIVFVHHSLADQNLTGNYWFEGLPQRCLIENREAVRKIIEESGKVIGVINGHLHWNQMNVHNGIPYFNIQSLVENFKSNGTASAAWALVRLDGDRIHVSIKGNDPAEY